MPYRSASLSRILPERAAEYYEGWLKEVGRSHDEAALMAFVAAHPFMFGTSVQTVVRGYHRWRTQRARVETPTAFAEYIARRAGVSVLGVDDQRIPSEAIDG